MNPAFEHHPAFNARSAAPHESPRHLKVTGVAPAYGFEPCEDIGCTVDLDGLATSCGRHACPACGCGGTNLSLIQLVDSATGIRVRCTCGNSWVRVLKLGELQDAHAHVFATG